VDVRERRETAGAQLFDALQLVACDGDCLCPAHELWRGRRIARAVVFQQPCFGAFQLRLGEPRTLSGEMQLRTALVVLRVVEFDPFELGKTVSGKTQRAEKRQRTVEQDGGLAVDREQ